MMLGAAVLVGYGFMVNLTSLDFSRLMGLYIVIFFVVPNSRRYCSFGNECHYRYWSAAHWSWRWAHHGLLASA